MPFTTSEDPFFAGGMLPEPRDSYVAWLDVMGVCPVMLRSLKVAAHFIFKLHVAALEAQRSGVDLYPVMDGIYVVAVTPTAMRSFLSSVFGRLADLFVTTATNDHRFLVKAGVAHGKVIHGRDVPVAASRVLGDHEAYKSTILLGTPVVHALHCAPAAPPMGVGVHVTAVDILTATQRRISSNWWPWINRRQDSAIAELEAALTAYFTWCEKRAAAIEYDSARIAAHRRAASQYLTIARACVMGNQSGVSS